MATWYKVNKWASSSIFEDNKWVNPIEVEKFTESSVWIGKNRNNRRSEYLNYFPTKEEAFNFALGRAQEKIDCLKDEFKKAEKDLTEIQVEINL